MNTMLQRNLEEGRVTLQSLAPMEAQIISAADTLTSALLSGHKWVACGNDGIAADASHLTAELVCRYNRDRRRYRALSLTVHGGDLTAIGNDYAFNDTFSRQVEAFGQPSDVLTAFSRTGSSENVRRALVTATQKCTLLLFWVAMGAACAGLARIQFLVSGCADRPYTGGA